MKIVFQISCLTLFQESQPIPVPGFQSTAGGEMSWILTNSCIKIAAIRGSIKRTRLPWGTRACSWVGAKFRFYQLQTCKKFGFTQRHKLVGKWYQKIIYYYHLRKNMLLRMTYITWSAACILNLVLLKRNKKKTLLFFSFPLCALCCWQSISLGDSADWAIWKCDWPDKSPFVYSPRIFPQTFPLDSRIFLDKLFEEWK